LAIKLLGRRGKRGLEGVRGDKKTLEGFRREK